MSLNVNVSVGGDETRSHATSSGSVCTTCPYCGVGCGVTATPVGRSIEIAGDKSHPANFGKLCAKGLALADTLSHENRLLSPRIGGRDVPWSIASNHIGDKFTQILNEHGPEAIAFYVSGQLLTEDYYVVNKFVKGFLGTANIDTNSRLCMASSVAGHKRAFGSDTVPGCYEDLEESDLVVLVGSNLAWCHPILFQRLEQAKSNNPALTIVVVDPRKTATAELSDIHLPIQAGGESDAVLFCGLLRYLRENNALDYTWIDAHTTGFSAAADKSRGWPPDKVAEHVGLTLKQVADFYSLFLRTEKVVTVYSQGVNQSHRGTDTVNSIINAHLATGRIGKPGCGPFSITGQPNAMGGREVGGLANMLACHMDIENATHRSVVQRYWNSPDIASEPGLKAVDMFNAVQSGQIKALWVMATNPVDSMPLANDIARAISNCPFVVVSDVVNQTDTSELANVQLPAQAWSEKSGTVTNSERRISRQRSFKSAPTLARSDWWAVCQVAHSMGFGASFDFQNSAQVFREYAGLSSFENNGTRDFDIGHYADIEESEYDALVPFQWPKPKTPVTDSKRFFADGRFYTPDAKARFVAIDADNNRDVRNSSKSVTDVTVDANVDANKVTFVLNTGRVRDQWHTMTRTGSSARLSAHIGEPFAELHPSDAKELGVNDASLVDVSSQYGSVTVRALITDRTPSGSIFIPMHWNNQFASNARVNMLVQDVTDPVSGQPALKNQRVSVRCGQFASYGFMITRNKPDFLDYFNYWAIAPIEQGWKTEFASCESAQLISNKLIDLADKPMPRASQCNYSDAFTSNFRCGWFSDESLLQAFYLAPEPVSVARQTVVTLFTHHFNEQRDRLAAVSGAGFADRPDTGATVCSCLNVGSKTIQQSIDTGCHTVQSVGAACGAGTQCGTCRSEISTMLKSVTEQAPLEQLAG